MTTPEFSYLAPAEVSTELLELLPEQGSVELQNDQPGKVFAWHKHDRHEELFVLSGDVTLFWVDAEGSYHEQECGQGSYIKLPAGTVHGSTAGGEGAHYVIKPEGGQTAVTTFLPQAEWPYPPASPVA